MELSKKVILAGHFGVGKTSLVRQFIHGQFSESYITTIGVKIDKKEIDVDGVHLNMILWDIAGESAGIKIPKRYFMGAHGLLYVFDMTREETFENIVSDMFEITKSNPNMPSIVLGNKSDLVNSSFIESLREDLNIDFSITSAKSGENVEETFFSLAKRML